MTNEIEIMQVRQGDGLSSAMVNISIGAIIRERSIKESVIDKSIQIVTYADDLVIIPRCRGSMENSCTKGVMAVEWIKKKQN